MKHYSFIALTVTSLLSFAGITPQPYPTAGSMRVVTFAPENNGTGWAIRQTGELFYLAGTAFHKLPLQHPIVRPPHLKFLGDASRGYYVQCLDYHKNIKYLYGLSYGEARLHTEPLAVEKDSEELHSNTYIAKDGRVVSWNTRRIALWRNDVWSELPALVAHDEGMPVIIEYEGKVIIVCGLLFHVIDADGKLTTQHPGWKYPTYSCVQWKGAVAIRTARGLPVPEAFDMISGQPLPLPQPFAEVRETITELRLSMNGTVWTKTERALYRLSPEGTMRIPLPLKGSMNIVAITDNMRHAAPLEQNQGWNVFFTDEQPGLSRWHAAGVERWDAKHGLDHQTIRNFAYTDDRTIWFLSTDVDSPVFRLPLNEVPPEAHEEQEDRWQTFNIHHGTQLMKMDDTIAFFANSELTLKPENLTYPPKLIALLFYIELSKPSHYLPFFMSLNIVKDRNWHRCLFKIYDSITSRNTCPHMVQLQQHLIDRACSRW